MKRKAREGQRASQPVNKGLWQELVHIWPRLVAMRAQEPAVSFSALKITMMTSEEEFDPERCVNIRLLRRRKVLRLFPLVPKFVKRCRAMETKHMAQAYSLFAVY